jgi:hypothetical protein
MMDDNGPGIQIKTQLYSGPAFRGNIRSFLDGWVRHFATANAWRRRHAHANTESHGYADPEPGGHRQALCVEQRRGLNRAF